MGAGLGVLFFVVEAAALWRSGVAGIDLSSVDDAASAVFKAIRPVLGGLLARVCFLYCTAGAGLALLSLFLSGKRWLVSWFAFLALIAAGHAVTRPALFDDVPVLRGVLSILTHRGELWHVYALLVVWLIIATRRRPVPSAAVGLACILTVNSIAPPITPRGLVLVIGIDAFRPDRLTQNGSARLVAPNLERFLQDATLFDRAYTPIGQTEPAWRSLLTARWPHRTGVRYPLTPRSRVQTLPTLPEALNGAGVSTAFFTDCSRFNFQGPESGFQQRVQPPRGALNFALEKMRFRGVGLFADNALGAWWLPEMIDNRALAGIYDPMGYADRLARKVVDYARNGPAFVAFHATAAHFPGDPVY
ncbi:MAG: sulfatase-like hydrolase/transferase, partial [Myxococcaceae bacterium]